MPVSRMKLAVTIKKMSMMNVTSSIGVRLISFSSSGVLTAAMCLRMTTLNLASVVHRHLVFENGDAALCLPVQNCDQEYARQCTDHAGHRRNRRHRHAGGHRPRITRPVERHDLEDRDHARHGPEQTEQRDRKSTRLNSSHVKISYAVF